MLDSIKFCDRSDLLSAGQRHANQPKPVKFLAESKFARNNLKKQTSWKKLCESKKNWQKYHSEDLSKTNFAS
ncbi:hypothetical protein, partial [Emticicia oligotrophica]|uniref:hypothetical protein n=1 Tax=Emticicia oligotrophica TaxID=312279 RepID=UPI00273B48D1